MAAVLWLCVALPAVGALGVLLAPRRAGTLAVLGALPATALAWVLLIGAAGGQHARSGVAWLPGAPGLSVGLRLDGLSAVMAATVASVGLVVIVYSTGYFAGSTRARAALAGLLAFLAAMEGLVLADGYLAMLIFWEIVGALSARLIAWSREDPAAPGGAVRAFLTTRTADLGFYLAVFAMYSAAGTIAFGPGRPTGALGAVVGIGLIVAAMGKSAQVPFQTWLAGAMAGPTPVSALLHSATMVAAGVYLLVRSHPLLAGWPLEVAGWVGALTAVLGAAIALGQRDLKRVLAGSTTSQLGFMFLGAAVGGPAVAIFYLIAHAAGKATLFLTAGIFQHNRGSTSLTVLAGAGREDRPAMAAFAVGAASIAAVPPLAVFWSKDAVLAALERHPAWFVLALIAAAGSAAYLLRPALILWGTRKPGWSATPPALISERSEPLAPATTAGGVAAEPRPRAARRAMFTAAASLAVASLGLGLVGAPLARLLGGGALPSSGLSVTLALLALFAGVAAVASRLSAGPALSGAARAQFYINEILRVVIQRPVLALARLTARFDAQVIDRAVDGTARGVLILARLEDRFERDGIDAAVDGLARLVGRGGREASRMESGRLYEYLRDTILGAVAVAFVIALAALT